jgi:hypothetical protein
MKTYDPEVGTSGDDWLAIDEAERIALVESYHRRRHIRVPQLTPHATIDVVVENQIALGEAVVIDALARLRAEGLTRHDAVHAIGTVLAGQIHELLKSSRDDTSPPTCHISIVCAASPRLSGFDLSSCAIGL